jgi:CheY-like chemotaxis protein
MLTSYDRSHTAAEARAAGIRRVLTKPVRRAQLLEALLVALSPEPTRPRQPRPPVASRRGPRAASPRKPHRSRRTRASSSPRTTREPAARARDAQAIRLQADVVGNGQEAIEAVLTVPYDLVLMDCQMPVMDGFEATRVIREREGAARHTCIVAVTANAMEGDRQRCLAAGMDDYVAKPFRADDLRRVLDQGLAGAATGEPPVHQTSNFS